MTLQRRADTSRALVPLGVSGNDMTLQIASSQREIGRHAANLAAIDRDLQGEHPGGLQKVIRGLEALPLGLGWMSKKFTSMVPGADPLVQIEASLRQEVHSVQDAFAGLSAITLQLLAECAELEAFIERARREDFSFDDLNVHLQQSLRQQNIAVQPRTVELLRRSYEGRDTGERERMRDILLQSLEDDLACKKGMLKVSEQMEQAGADIFIATATSHLRISSQLGYTRFLRDAAVHASSVTLANFNAECTVQEYVSEIAQTMRAVLAGMTLIQEGQLANATCQELQRGALIIEEATRGLRATQIGTIGARSQLTDGS